MSLAAPQVMRNPSTAMELLINMPDMRGTLEAIGEKLRAREGFTLFTLNLDHVVKLDHDRPFREAYQRASLVTADGWPVVWIVRNQQARPAHERRSVQRTAGADLLAPVCQQAAEQGVPVYFVGPSPASQAAGIEILRQRYPGMIVAGAEAPQLPRELNSATVDAIAERVRLSGARICVLSLGAPKQELLADALYRKCPDVGFLCVGAALDFISGHAVRAPLWVQRAGMEWFWRMANDPWRLTGRYMRCGFALLKLACPNIFPRGPRLRLSTQV